LKGEPELLPTVQELCLLRQGSNEVFFWFAGNLLESVTGINNAWGAEKYFIESMTTATDGKGNSWVTVSDEAFALLLYENYVEKWKTRYNNGWSVRGAKRMMGKYSSSSSGNQTQSGWSPSGLKRFNELVELVIRDRKSDGAAEKEKLLYQYNRSTERGQKIVDRAGKASAGKQKFDDMDDAKDSDDEGGGQEVEVYDEL